MYRTEVFTEPCDLPWANAIALYIEVGDVLTSNLVVCNPLLVLCTVCSAHPIGDDFCPCVVGIR